MIGYIYKITNSSGNIYIGQTISLKDRIRKYRTLKCKSQKALYNSISKYGWDQHTFEIIDNTMLGCIDLLDSKEIYWIKYYNSHNNGLNCTDGGDGQRGRKISEETRQKMRDSGGHMKGKKFTQEHKDKISASHVGKVVSEETRIKQSELRKGIPTGRKTNYQLGKKRGPYKIKN